MPLTRRVQYTHGSQVHSHTLEDISEGGLSLLGASPLPVRQRVKLFVPLPRPGSRDSLCMLVGEVVYNLDGRVGIRFVDPPLECLLQLRGYVQLAA